MHKDHGQEKISFSKKGAVLGLLSYIVLVLTVIWVFMRG